MHVNGEWSNEETTHLWLNSKVERSDNKPHISFWNASAASFVAEVAILTKDNKFSYHDLVKAGNFIGFYAIVTETTDTSRMDELDELEINYLKKSFTKWIVYENNIDSREIRDLIRIRAQANGRSWYSIIE